MAETEEKGLFDSWGSFFEYGIDKFVEVEKAKATNQPPALASDTARYVRNEDDRTVRAGSSGVKIAGVTVTPVMLAGAGIGLVVLLLLLRR